jgi:hypothetical protein
MSVGQRNSTRNLHQDNWSSERIHIKCCPNVSLICSWTPAGGGEGTSPLFGFWRVSALKKTVENIKHESNLKTDYSCMNIAGSYAGVVPMFQSILPPASIWQEWDAAEYIDLTTIVHLWFG